MIMIMIMRTKLLRAYGGCLGAKSRRRAWLAAISFGEPSAGVISGDSRMGKPTWGNAQVSLAEQNRLVKASGGTETSQYPEEKRLFPE